MNPWRPIARSAARTAVSADTLFWAWALHAGVVVFLAWWMWRLGLWGELVRADPSGLSIAIVAMSITCSAWIGRRAWTLARESHPSRSAWRDAYLADVAAGRAQAAELLAERTHGPHEVAWWVAAAAIKLGLLGTVVGFIVMATQIGRLQVFDISEVQVLLQRMTQGMAIALYTTLAGLAANLWLGLQLLLLDRMADSVAAAILGDDHGLR